MIESNFLLVNLGMSAIISTLFKGLIKDSRPFLFNKYRGEPGEGIYASYCSLEFGSPSGHALFSFYIAAYYYIMYVWKDNAFSEYEDSS